jgi:hypothetical protein
VQAEAWSSLAPGARRQYGRDERGRGRDQVEFASGSSCLGGAATADGTVYWGTGYRAFAPLSTAGNKLFAFRPGS